jgi:hypothetical protein
VGVTRALVERIRPSTTSPNFVYETNLACLNALLNVSMESDENQLFICQHGLEIILQRLRDEGLTPERKAYLEGILKNIKRHDRNRSKLYLGQMASAVRGSGLDSRQEEEMVPFGKPKRKKKAAKGKQKDEARSLAVAKTISFERQMRKPISSAWHDIEGHGSRVSPLQPATSSSFPASAPGQVVEHAPLVASMDANSLTGVFNSSYLPQRPKTAPAPLAGSGVGADGTADGPGTKASKGLLLRTPNVSRSPQGLPQGLPTDESVVSARSIPTVAPPAEYGSYLWTPPTSRFVDEGHNAEGMRDYRCQVSMRVSKTKGSLDMTKFTFAAKLNKDSRTYTPVRSAVAEHSDMPPDPTVPVVDRLMTTAQTLQRSYDQASRLAPVGPMTMHSTGLGPTSSSDSGPGLGETGSGPSGGAAEDGGAVSSTTSQRSGAPKSKLVHRRRKAPQPVKKYEKLAIWKSHSASVSAGLYPSLQLQDGSEVYVYHQQNRPGVAAIEPPRESRLSPPLKLEDLWLLQTPAQPDETFMSVFDDELTPYHYEYKLPTPPQPPPKKCLMPDPNVFMMNIVTKSSSKRDSIVANENDGPVWQVWQSLFEPRLRTTDAKKMWDTEAVKDRMFDRDWMVSYTVTRLHGLRISTEFQRTRAGSRSARLWCFQL